MNLVSWAYGTIFHMLAPHPLVQKLLETRGIEISEELFSPSYENRPSPFLMRGMEKAVSRILSALEKNETICVWSDYDCDGVPGGALMRDFFALINYPLISYIPERNEGYGLNNKGIAELKEQGVSLIITVDNGITAMNEVVYAKELGVDVIVTDHHLPRTEVAKNGEARDIVPDAVAVLDPHQMLCEYPFKELCGTGVAFKLAEAVLERGGFDIPAGSEKWLLDLVALATVADMVPLVGENRTLVHYGFVVLKKGRRKGLKALLEKMRLPLAYLTEDDISFSIAPKINAASRMKSPHLALELLTTTDDVRAKELAKELVRLNDARKLEGARVAKEVKHRLEGTQLNDVIVLGNSDWKPALLGIAATNIVETYSRTVCLWGKDGELIKGSCRSDGSVNIVSLMTEAKEVFEEFGGHELSGGFSLKNESVHILPSILQTTYARVKKNDASIIKKGVVAELQVTISELTHSLYKALRAIGPFGMGNPKPLFELYAVRVERIILFGAHKEHARIVMSDEHGHSIDSVSFFVSRTPFKEVVDLLSEGDLVNVVGAFEQSFFANKKELRLRLEDIVLQK